VKKLCRLLAAVALAFSSTEGASQQQSESAGRGDTPYLLLVTFYDLTGAGRLSALNGSPFDGIAVPMVDAYSSGPELPFEKVQSNFASLQRETRKQLWPWIFINRMVGAKDTHEERSASNSHESKALDLDDSIGARTAFLNIWRLALREAESSGTPGVVLDMELYSNAEANSVSLVAKQRSLAPDEVKKRLREIGYQMAGIASEEFPDAIVWTLVSGLSPDRYVLNIAEQDSTCGYILLGLMDGIRERHSGMTVIDGGEDSLGYCHKSAVALGEDISERLRRFTPLLQDYANTLTLGGTIALWRDSASRSDWLLSGRCGSSDVNQPEEFTPYLRLLFQNYRFVWIYAPIDGHWDPLNSVESMPLNRTLLEAEASTPRQ
jgi:hypothetical protein